MTGHLTAEQLEAGLDEVLLSPADHGTLELIVRRPAVDAREVLESGELTEDDGVVGDNWNRKPSNRGPDGGPHPDMQLNVINSRLLRLVAGDAPDRMALAGDQLVVDLDLSGDTLPAGTRLAIGSAVIEVTAEPHTGCAKFTQRFGLDAMRFVNSDTGRTHNLRGVNAKVVQAGTITRGDTITRL